MYTPLYFFIFGCPGSSLLCRLFSSCGKRGLLGHSVACLGRSGFSLQWFLLLWSTDSRHMASVVSAQGLISYGSWALECAGFSRCGIRTPLLHWMWDLPRPGIEPLSLALTRGFFFLRHQGSLVQIISFLCVLVLPHEVTKTAAMIRLVGCLSRWLEFLDHVLTLTFKGGWGSHHPIGYFANVASIYCKTLWSKGQIPGRAGDTATG